MTGKDSRKRLRMEPIYDERKGQNTLRRYLGAFLILTLVSFAAYICFKFLLTCVLILLNIIDAVIENANRSTHTLVIRRFDDELHVETQIDPKLQISHESLAPQKQRNCIPRETVKDFEKGTEVFSKGDDCFVRFYNHSEESYDQQMRLFQMLKGLPLQQPAEPVVYQAVQHLQFTDRLYELLGRQVAARCNMRRLFWIFPAAPLLARHLTECRCIDTLHARISVCLQLESQVVEATRLSDFTETTGEVQTKRPKRKPPVVRKPRRGIDRIVMKPDDMQLE